MDVVWLSRLQFATATYFHFLFVPLTLGLSLLLAVMETRYARSGDLEFLRMTKFWGRIFLINFATGVVTGITLEFQFGTNWAGYSAYVGDIFGPLLAIEATAAFFMESTFIGVWIFGWKKLSAKAHATVMWLVAFASSFSAVWILTANAWMQHPVGYKINPLTHRAELTNFLAVVTQATAVLKILHTVSGGIILSAFFVMGVSAYHLLRKQHVEFFRKSFRLALAFGLIFSIIEIVEGDEHAVEVAHTQPTKLAAMEARWHTATHVPMYLLLLPRATGDGNVFQALPVPDMLSILAYRNPSATVRGLLSFPKNDRPPVLVTFLAFRIMVGLGAYFVLMTLIGWFRRHKLEDSRWYLRAMLCSIPLPYVALTAGWTVAEVGRQPWIVYGLMRTKDAVSHIAPSEVLVTLIGFIVVYGLLGIVAFSLIIRTVRRGPDPVPVPAGAGAGSVADSQAESRGLAGDSGKES